MEIVMVIIILALFMYGVFSFRVGMARSRYGVAAPAVSGNEMFERFYRVQQNTLEQLMLFIPAILIFSSLAEQHGWNEALIAGSLGMTWIVGRLIYSAMYIRDPRKRGLGFALTLLPSILMMVLSLFLLLTNMVETL